MKIALGADHGGLEIKEAILETLQARNIATDDLGCYDAQPVDYPDYAQEVSIRVSRGEADQGILVCTTGIGMSIAANRFPGIRAALCVDPVMAEKARTHNDANVLVLGAKLSTPTESIAILDTWLSNSFSSEERHARRVRKMDSAGVCPPGAVLREDDPDVFGIIHGEEERQQKTIDLIASENYTSRQVREAIGSVLCNKYAEGYPGKRWYRGCGEVDQVEQLAIDRLKALFAAEHANVQPHCGSSANMAAYFSVLSPGDRILSMSLNHGGHLTHGHTMNFSGKLFQFDSYGVDRETGRIDYDEVARIAAEKRPRMIVAGASAYPRIIDFSRFREIADSVGAYFLVDMAHIAGLVAGGSHPSPVPHADFVTSTTHKTLRGPRGAFILCREQHAADVDREVFPGLQGGPFMHSIAARAVCFGLAQRPDFREYASQVVRNAQAMAHIFVGEGCRLISGGTDNHLMLLDVSAMGLNGNEAAIALEKAGIVANKNVIPFDTNNAFVTSGLRFGTPAITTRGMKEPQIEHLAGMILEVLRAPRDESGLTRVREKVFALSAEFPVR